MTRSQKDLGADWKKDEEKGEKRKKKEGGKGDLRRWRTVASQWSSPRQGVRRMVRLLMET